MEVARLGAIVGRHFVHCLHPGKAQIMAARAALHPEKPASDGPTLPTCASHIGSRPKWETPGLSLCSPAWAQRQLEPSDKYRDGVSWVGPGGAQGRGAGC